MSHLNFVLFIWWKVCLLIPNLVSLNHIFKPNPKCNVLTLHLKQLFKPVRALCTDYLKYINILYTFFHFYFYLSLLNNFNNFLLSFSCCLDSSLFPHTRSIDRIDMKDTTLIWFNNQSVSTFHVLFKTKVR